MRMQGQHTDAGRHVRTAMVVAALYHGALPAAQTLPRKFEVVSIRALPANAPMIVRPADFTPVQPGGRFQNASTTVISLITFAYGVNAPDSRLLGLPEWKGTRYDVSARAADDLPQLSPADNREQVRLMVREMLAERFRLRLHTETRQETVLRMLVDSGGFQLKEVTAPVPPEQEGRVSAALSDSGGRLVVKKGTMAGLAKVVALFLKQDVVDATGLNGYYDFDIRWSAPLEPNLPRPSRTSVGADGLALFQSALKEHFGLRFSRDTAPVQYWIVDHIEPPKEN